MTVAALHSVVADLLSGDVEGLIALFDGDVDIDLPESGRVVGALGAADAVDAYRGVFGDHTVQVTPINEITDATGRSVLEVSLAFGHRSNPMTVALVADHSDTGLLRVRGYHAMQPYRGCYTPRPQMLDLPAVRPAVPDVVAQYFDAVHHHPNLERTLALYADDACLVAPPGHRAQGSDALRFIYTLFLESGGIALHHCATIDNGRSVAIEWVCDRWGASVFPDLEAGCAVYDYADGQLHGARIYDDLEPPFDVPG